jgi:hypothetical protein
MEEMPEGVWQIKALKLENTYRSPGVLEKQVDLPVCPLLPIAKMRHLVAV